MLRDICEQFDIATADIKVTKKASYIQRIVAFASVLVRSDPLEC